MIVSKVGWISIQNCFNTKTRQKITFCLQTSNFSDKNVSQNVTSSVAKASTATGIKTGDRQLATRHLDHDNRRRRRRWRTWQRRRGINFAIFYVKLLSAQFPKAQKDTDNFTIFLRFWDLNFTNILWAAFFVQKCLAQLFSNYCFAL